MADREKLIELLNESEILCDTCGENTKSYCTEALADHLIANGVVVREKGEWVEFLDIAYDGSCNGSTYKCPKCSEIYSDVEDVNFCPNCGADMRKGENG